MDKKEYKSPHGWIILLLIVFTLSLFLIIMVYTIEQENTVQLKKQTFHKKLDEPKVTIAPMITTKAPTTPLKIMRGQKVLYRNDKLEIINDALKRHLHSLPDTIVISEENFTMDVYSTKNIALTLHGYEVQSISKGNNFYIYHGTIVPAEDYLVVTILMELPQINVMFKDYPEYSEYCPSINPYIHVVEAVYKWGYDKETLETYNKMTLTNLKLYMVSWEDNLYNKSYQQVKNSPLYKTDVPVPLNLKKEELYDFLTDSTIFNEIPMVFNPPITLASIQNNTPIS